MTKMFSKALVISLPFIILGCSDNSEKEKVETQEYVVATITGNTFNDECITTGEPFPDNSYEIKITFSSNNNIIKEQKFTGKNTVSVNETTQLEGENISVLLNLENFNPSDKESGKGTGISDIKIAITNEEGNLLLDENLGSLLICTDTYYEIAFNYNKVTGNYTITPKQYGF